MRNKVLVGLSFVLLATSANAGDRIGVIGAANRNITAVSADSAKRDLKLGDNIYFKDTVSADATGNAQLLFVDKSALTVGANSSVVIDEFVYNPATSSGNLVMRSTKGTFRFIGGALSKKDEVQLKTPVGTIGIRGGIAIVKIDGATGATNATFVYGDKMTFKNLAGEMQSVTNKGLGISVDSPNAMPKVVQLTTDQIAAQVTDLAGKPGTNAGAAVVPTEKDMGKSLVVDGDKGANANDNKAPLAGDKPKDGTAADKPKDGPVNKDNTDGKNGNNNGGANGNPNATTPGKTGAATGVNEPGSKLTADGGYVDSNGKYHTPAELAAERAAGNTGTAANGNNANGGYVAGGTANGGTYAGGAVGNNNQIQLTNDGGFIDANGVKRGPAELAAYRATNAMQTGGDRPAPVTTNWGNIKEPITGPISIVKPIDVIQPPPVIIDPTKITTVNPIDTVARDLRNQGFIRAKNAGATDAEATASGAAAEAYFRNSIENGTEFTAAVTATNVSITTYINANFPGTYVAQPKPGVADPDNYADAVAAGTAAYTTAKNNGYGHSYAVGQGNIAYNSTLTSLEQDYEDDLFETDAANNDTVYTTAGVDIQDHINNSTAVSNPLLTQYVSGNYTQNLENAMDAAKASCSGCSYMDWDYWGHIQSNTSPSPMTDLQQQVVPYVYGDATLPANIPGTVGSPINAVYTGKSVLTTNGMHEIGNIQANITLSGAGSASLTGFQFNIPSQGATLSFGGSQAIGGTASFNNLSVSGSGFTGVVNGALFGPAAENVGGNMTYNNGGTVSGAGVYMGARP